MLDVVTCEGCGRKTYAQLDHCPQCGRAITVPHIHLNLPPKYVYEDQAGVWVYPAKMTRLGFNFLLLVGGILLLALGYYVIWLDRFNSPPGFIAGPTVMALGGTLVFQSIQLTFRLLKGLPVFYMGEKGIAFPHLSGELIPWAKIGNARVIEVGEGISKRRRPEIELTSPEKIVLYPIIRWLIRRPQQRVVVPLFTGWPITPDDIRDLILLGLETWTKGGRKAFSSPIPQEINFELAVKLALGTAAFGLLFLFAILILIAVRGA